MLKITLISFLLFPLNALSADELHKQMLLLDQQMFHSFNKCTDKLELKKHGDMFAVDVEFYHDNGGVTWSREVMLKNTEKNVCGNFYRQLVDDSFKSFPIAGFGAITQGTHVFCSFETKKCEGKADFTMVWRLLDNKWEVTRALSYGHREN
jgi:hypothetical protein